MEIKMVLCPNCKTIRKLGTICPLCTCPVIVESGTEFKTSADVAKEQNNKKFPDYSPLESWRRWA
jgi:hypothetical protein